MQSRIPPPLADVLVVGGGVHGAAIARDAAARGLVVVLVEARDFAWGTSSRSSKLAHGGLRYLEHLELGLVRESLRERNTLLRLAPHLTWPLPFLIPLSGPAPRAGWKVRVGLSVYDFLAGRSPVARHRVVSAAEAQRMAPALEGSGLEHAAEYHDAGMDDARIVVELVVDACALGAACLPHVEAVELLRDGRGVVGARTRDALDPAAPPREVRARTTVVACGPWTDVVAPARVSGSSRLVLTKGVHVFTRRELVRDAALMLASPDDGRIFFLIPWRGGCLVGTTDTPFLGAPAEARATPDDVRYLLHAVNLALPAARLGPEDVVAVQAGVRPLVGSDDVNSPSAISRDYELDRSTPGLVVVEGGKFTIFRKLAARVVDHAVHEALEAEPGRALRACSTHERLLPGATEDFASFREEETRRLEGISGEKALFPVQLADPAPGQGDHGCVKPSQLGPADHRHLGRRWVGEADPNVGADQQAAGVGGRILFLRLAEQDPGADREQLGGKGFIVDRVAGGGAKGVVRRHLAAEQVGQDAVVLKQAEQLAGHDSLKGLNPAVAQLRPFVVGSGMADQGVGIGQAGGNSAEQLHLLAAHDVGPAVPEIGNARNDRLAVARPD